MKDREALQARYAIRDDGTGWFAVYDIFTGQTAEIDGVPQDGLDAEAADDIAVMLNIAYSEKRAGTSH